MRGGRAMSMTTASPSLLDVLPPVRGRYSENVSLANITWFRVGGPAEVMFRPVDHDDLVAFLKAKSPEIPVTVLGVGSNVLVRDGGIAGVVVRLGRGFAEISINDDLVTASAAALDVNVAQTCTVAGIGGLEFLCGVPGTIGGALRMNAGAYGREMVDVTLSATAVDPQGEVHSLTCAELGFGYRSSGVPANWIFTAARFQGVPSQPQAIAERMAKIRAAREASQPIRNRTGGSTFANPGGPRNGDKAWELIERAKCRGLRVGGATVSDKHCNFLVNTGNATASDIERLGEDVRQRVAAATGVTLRWEIQRLGEPSPRSAANRDAR